MPVFTLKPTNAYFFAKENNILTEHELMLCERAAKEFVRDKKSEQFDSSLPCDLYFSDLVNSKGCIAFDDELDDVRAEPVNTFTAPHMFLKYYYQQSVDYVKENMNSEYTSKSIEAWHNEITSCITPYLEKRAGKYNQFVSDVLCYIDTGDLPEKMRASSQLHRINPIVDRFSALDEDEQQLLADKIKSQQADRLEAGSVSCFQSLFSRYFPNEKDVRAQELLDSIAPNNDLTSSVSRFVMK